MERRRGLVVRRQTPPEIGEDLGLRRRVGEAIVDTLAELHAVDICSNGLARIGKPVGFMQRQVKGWADRWERAKSEDVAAINNVVRWLSDRLPPDPDPRNPPALVHNDFKLDNVMLDYRDPAKVVAVLDWEMCTVGDRLADVGVLLCYWPEKRDSEARRESISPVTTEPGWMTRQEVVERYAARTGRDLSGIAFYETFALFKIAVVLQQIYIRYLKGQTHDERFKDLGRRVAGLAQSAWDRACGSGADSSLRNR